MSLIVDGVRGREYTSVDSVRFTDDGKAAYLAQAGTRWFVVTGGEESDVIWSPDSKYTLHYGAPGTQFGSEFGMFLGNRYVSLGNTSRIALPTFTPDGKHLFWAVEAGQRGMMEIWLDGKMVFEFDEQGRAPMIAPGGWEMGKDGVLRFVVQTVEGFKRVQITPGAEDGVAAMLAKGKPAKR